MAKTHREARDSAEARLDAIVSPVADAVARKAGVKPPRTARDKAEERLSRPADKAGPVIARLKGLSKPELQKVAEAIDDMLNETK